MVPYRRETKRRRKGSHLIPQEKPEESGRQLERAQKKQCP